MAVAEQPPIRLVVHDDDLTRNRLTVFFRLFLAIPHFIWLMLWGLAASVVAFVLWLAILISAEAPEILHDFVAGYVRYATHLSACSSQRTRIRAFAAARATRWTSRSTHP